MTVKGSGIKYEIPGKSHPTFQWQRETSVENRCEGDSSAEAIELGSRATRGREQTRHPSSDKGDRRRHACGLADRGGVAVSA